MRTIRTNDYQRYLELLEDTKGKRDLAYRFGNTWFIRIFTKKKPIDTNSVLTVKLKARQLHTFLAVCGANDVEIKLMSNGRSKRKQQSDINSKEGFEYVKINALDALDIITFSNIMLRTSNDLPERTLSSVRDIVGVLGEHLRGG